MCLAPFEVAKPFLTCHRPLMLYSLQVYPPWLEGSWSATSRFVGFEFPTLPRQQVMRQELEDIGFIAYCTCTSDMISNLRQRHLVGESKVIIHAYVVAAHSFIHSFLH